MGLDRGETLLAVGLTSGRKVVLRGTNRLGREIVAVIEGDELAKHLLHRARKGCRVTQKLKSVGFGRES
jgi:hypothetical protein